MENTNTDIVITDDHELLLKKGYKKAEAAARKNSSAENMKALAATKKLLDDYRASCAAPGEQPFKAIGDILYYLRDTGWKVSQSKLYEDKNIIGMERDGSFTKKAIDKYAMVHLKKLDGSDADLPDMAEKIKAETRIAKAKAEKLEHENEVEHGRWTRTSEIEQLLSFRGALLMEGVGPGFIHRAAEKVVETVDGNNDKIPELVELWLREVEDLFDQYSKPVDFTVPAAKGTDI